MMQPFKRIFLLVLISVLAIPISSGVVFAEDFSHKLSKDFQAHLETMNDTDMAQIAVYATGEITYLTQEEYEKKVIEMMGEEDYRFALTGSPQYAEQVNKLIELDKQFKREAEQAFQKEFMEEIGLKETNDMVMSGVSVTFKATKIEILRFAEEERVDYILWMKDETPIPDVTGTDVTVTNIGNEVVQIFTGTSYIYKYNAVSALHILKAAVGKEEGALNRLYDVNADAINNAVDALWALQSGVGKRVVEYPLDYAFPE